MIVQTLITVWNKPECDEEFAETNDSHQPRRNYIVADIEMPELPDGWSIESIAIAEPLGEKE